MPDCEAAFYVREELALGKGRLAAMEIEILPGGYVNLRPHYDTVIRVRRVTGYLSATVNFNDAKRAEMAAREGHI